MLLDGSFVKVRNASLGSFAFGQLNGETVFGLLFGWMDDGVVERHIVDLNSSTLSFYSLRESSLVYVIDRAEFDTSASAMNLNFSDGMGLGHIAFSETGRHLVLRHEQLRTYVHVDLATGMIPTERGPRIVGSITEWRVIQRRGEVEHMLAEFSSRGTHS